MKNSDSHYSQIQAATAAIQKQCSLKPRIGLVIGSGLGSLANDVSDATILPYSEIPGFHSTSILGHAGRLILGKISGIPVLLLDGRFHRYEGHPLEDVVLPTRVAGTLGIKTLILTNAAGGINTRFRAGDVMLIEDHLNLTGENPLVGKNLSDLGPRFPDMTEAYSKRALEILKTVASKADIPVHQGVYGGLMGPTYETPAEVRDASDSGSRRGRNVHRLRGDCGQSHGHRSRGLELHYHLAAGLSPLNSHMKKFLIHPNRGRENEKNPPSSFTSIGR
jgi:purine-nucleoside phosphorylase